MNKKTLSAALALGIIATLTLAACNQHRSENASQTEQPEPQTKTIAGLTFYYGIVKGETVKGHPAAHSEASMHKGPPGSPATYHIVLTLVETATNRRITNAGVAMRLSRLNAPVSEWLPMEAMRNAGTESFGRYAELPESGRYLLEFQVNRVGAPKTVTARFAFERPG
jgi:hypothetical protein